MHSTQVTLLICILRTQFGEGTMLNVGRYPAHNDKLTCYMSYGCAVM